MSTREITGNVEVAFKDAKTGRCSLKMDDGEWYSTFKDHYPELQGRTVKLTLKQNGKYWNVTGKPEVVEAAPSAAGGRAGGGAGDRQSSIVLQSSYKTAAELSVVMLEHDMLTIPTKKAAKYDAFLGYVDEIALRIYNNCIDTTDFLAGESSDAPAVPAGEEYDPANV